MASSPCDLFWEPDVRLGKMLDTWTANIVLVRHGFSIVNALSYIKDLPVKESTLEHIVDPHLTSFGVDATKVNGKSLFAKLKKMQKFQDGINLVVSSNMTRAIETAFYLQTGRKDTNQVFVMPYLKETGLRQKRKDAQGNCTLVSHPWNRPAPLKEQKKYFKKLGLNPDYAFIDDECQWDTESGISKFLKWFGKGGRFALILKSGKPLTAKQIQTKTFNIIVVCHGGVMHDFLQEHDSSFRHSPDNNEAFFGSVTFSGNGCIEKIGNFKNVHYPGMVESSSYPTDHKAYCADPRSAPICPKI